jgi:hypothetical protein
VGFHEALQVISIRFHPGNGERFVILLVKSPFQNHLNPILRHNHCRLETACFSKEIISTPKFLSTAYFPLPTAFCQLLFANCLFPTAYFFTYCLLPTAFCQLPFTYCILFCLLPFANCFLPTAFCLLPFAYCLLFAYCPLPTAYFLLTAFCLLPTAFCLLPTFLWNGET